MVGVGHVGTVVVDIVHAVAVVVHVGVVTRAVTVSVGALRGVEREGVVSVHHAVVVVVHVDSVTHAVHVEVCRDRSVVHGVRTANGLVGVVVPVHVVVVTGLVVRAVRGGFHHHEVKAVVVEVHGRGAVGGRQAHVVGAGNCVGHFDEVFVHEVHGRPGPRAGHGGAVAAFDFVVNGHDLVEEVAVGVHAQVDGVTGMGRNGVHPPCEVEEGGFVATARVVGAVAAGSAAVVHHEVR